MAVFRENVGIFSTDLHNVGKFIKKECSSRLSLMCTVLLSGKGCETFRLTTAYFCTHTLKFGAFLQRNSSPLQILDQSVCLPCTDPGVFLLLLLRKLQRCGSDHREAALLLLAFRPGAACCL